MLLLPYEVFLNLIYIIMNKKLRNHGLLTITLPLYVSLLIWFLLMLEHGNSTVLFISTIGTGMCYYFCKAAQFKKKLQEQFPLTKDYQKAVNYYRKWHILC